MEGEARLDKVEELHNSFIFLIRSLGIISYLLFKNIKELFLQYLSIMKEICGYSIIEIIRIFFNCRIRICD